MNATLLFTSAKAIEGEGKAPEIAPIELLEFVAVRVLVVLFFTNGPASDGRVVTVVLSSRLESK